MSGRVVHFEIPYDDRERASAFYREAFGWDLQRWGEGDYTMVATGPVAADGPTEPGFINGGMLSRAQSASGAPVVVVEVDDIDQVLSGIEKLGGATVTGRQPVGDMGFSAYIRDPEGNVVGLWQNAGPQG